jgi:hypothetical protein
MPAGRARHVASRYIFLYASCKEYPLHSTYYRILQIMKANAVSYTAIYGVLTAGTVV